MVHSQVRDRIGHEAMTQKTRDAAMTSVGTRRDQTRPNMRFSY